VPQLRHRVGSLSAAQWEPLDSRFAQLKERIADHRKWLDSMVGLHNQEGLDEQQRRHLRPFNTSLHTTHVGAENGGMARYSQYSLALLPPDANHYQVRRIQRIKSWLSNCNGYQDIYEHRVHQRHPNTCGWFLTNPVYCRWKNAPFDQKTANNTAALDCTWHDRILFVQG
jgi:hypothetical protein